MSTDVTRNNDSNTMRSAGAICAGFAAGHLTKTILTRMSGEFSIKKWEAVEKSVDGKIIKAQKENLLKVSGLKNKGVKIIDFAEKEKDIGKVQSELTGRLWRFLKNKEYTFTRKVKAALNFGVKLGNLTAQSSASAGDNAYAQCSLKSNSMKVLINTDKVGLALPHELGHCKNYTNRFWKTISCSKPCFRALAALTALVGICTPKKSAGEKTNGAADIVVTFIKNNIGILTAATFIPEIADELKATYNGNRYAKQVFSPDIAKKAAKLNKYGALSYLGFAAAAGTAAWAGSKIRDLIA